MYITLKSQRFNMNRGRHRMRKYIEEMVVIAVSVVGFASCTSFEFPAEYGVLVHRKEATHIRGMRSNRFIMMEDGLYIVDLKRMEREIPKGEPWDSDHLGPYMTVPKQFSGGARKYADMKLLKSKVSVWNDVSTQFISHEKGGVSHYSVLSIWNPDAGSGYTTVNLYVSNYIAVKGLVPDKIVFHLNGSLLREEDVAAYIRMTKRDLRHISIAHDPRARRVDVYVRTKTCK